MQFYPLSKYSFLYSILALGVCFFITSCAADAIDITEQPIDFDVEQSETELQSAEQEAPIIPKTRADFIASLKTLYAAQHLHEVKISLMQGTLEQQKNEIISLQKTIAGLVPVKTAVKNSIKVASEQVNPAYVSERQAYTTALNTLEAGQAQVAEALFTNFLTSYPASSLAPNAEYWLGECFYSQKRYSDAILAFQNVTAQYPKHNKASASLLKTAYAYERLSDVQNAIFYLQQLLENYPASEPEALARAALKRLR
jgi:tol-pal system protein YbgF